MKHNASRLARWTTLLTLALLVTACSTVPPVVVPPPAIPKLPPEARQPPMEPECQPTCSAGLSRLLNAMQRSPTSEASPAKPANGTPTH